MQQSKPSAAVEVTAIVITHDSEDVLPDCIGALAPAFEGVSSWNLVIADNASTDGTIAIVGALAPDATVLEMGTNAGYATAINVAVSSSRRSDHLLILNPDVRLEPRSAAALLTAVERPGVGIAVPRIRDLDGSLDFSLRRAPTVLRALTEALIGGTRAARRGRLSEVIGDTRQYAYERSTEWATGAAMLVSRECFDEVGPWDESFFLYSEETDFALRARDLGYLTWYTPAARAVHRGGDSNVSPRLWSILVANRVRLFGKRHGRAHAFAFAVAVGLNEAIRAASGRATSRAALRALRRLGGPSTETCEVRA